MRRFAAPLLVLLLLVAADATAAKKVPPKKPTPERIAAAEAAKSPLQSLVSAEQAFARMSLAKNTRDAFVANLAEDCIMFRPLPVNGFELYQGRPVTAAKLAWEPVYAEVSGAGDLGVTTGPWEFTPPPDKPNAEKAYGEFFSVWRRSQGKPWKVALDFGISHPRPDMGLGSTPLTAGPAHAMAAGSPGGADDGALNVSEALFSHMAQQLNPARAVVTWTTADVRYLHEGEVPRMGDDARNAMSAAPSRTAYHTLGSVLASSADLGFTYGVREDSAAAPAQAPDSTVYVHVWRLTDANTWRIAVAVEQPIRRGGS